MGAAARRILKRGGTRLIRDSAWLGGRALARRAGAVGHIRGLCRHNSHLHRNCADHTVQRRGHPMGQLARGGAAALGLGDLHPRRARRVLHGAVAAAVRVHVGTRLGAVRDAVRQVFMG